MYKLQKTLVEKWCLATVNDAVKLFHKARVHPDNEAIPLEEIAIRCSRSALENVSSIMVGDKDSTTKRYLELCYARFKREIAKVVTEPEKEEYVC